MVSEAVSFPKFYRFGLTQSQARTVLAAREANMHQPIRTATRFDMARTQSA
jgi:hypothetical protein